MSANDKCSFVLCINTELYLEEPKAHTSREIRAQNKEALLKFRTELELWAAVVPTTDIAIVKELPNLGLLLIECSTITSERLKLLRGVESVTVNGRVGALK